MRGGYRKNAGRPKGARNAKVVARERGRARALRLAEVTAERTMLQIARHAFADRRQVWVDGKLLPIGDWSADAGALLESFEVVIKNAAAGDGHTDTVHKVHLSKPLHALELLAKHFGLVTDKHEITHKVEDQQLAMLESWKQQHRLPAQPDQKALPAAVNSVPDDVDRVR